MSIMYSNKLTVRDLDLFYEEKKQSQETVCVACCSLPGTGTVLQCSPGSRYCKDGRTGSNSQHNKRQLQKQRRHSNYTYH